MSGLCCSSRSVENCRAGGKGRMVWIEMRGGCVECGRWGSEGGGGVWEVGECGR